MCRICKYNQVQDIDRLLLAGAPLTQLSQTYPFSRSELQRHQQHLNDKITLASKRFHTRNLPKVSSAILIRQSREPDTGRHSHN